MWRKNFLIPFLIGARYPRDQQMIKYGLFNILPLFLSTFLVLCTLFMTRIQAESIVEKDFRYFQFHNQI